MRDCENCKHRIMKVEVGKGTPPEHFWGCECWECEFEPTAKNNLAVDCISRADAQTEIEMNASRYTIARKHGGMGQVEWSDQLIKVSDAVDIIRHLPSVTPQEPRKGHWIEIGEESGALGVQYKKKMCSVCKWSHSLIIPKNACPNCGAKMVEPQESEEV